MAKTAAVTESQLKVVFGGQLGTAVVITIILFHLEKSLIPHRQSKHTDTESKTRRVQHQSHVHFLRHR